MASRIKSGIKKHRQSLKKRARNTAVKSELKTQLKKFVSALSNGDVEFVQNTLRETQAKLKKAGSKSVISKKTAARKVSRLSKLVSRSFN